LPRYEAEESMSEQSRHDAWQAGEDYDAYMGRWSRQIAGQFLAWLAPSPRRDWLEVGCGTGALTEQIMAHGNPRSLLAIDPSPNFVGLARQRLDDDHLAFEIGDAQALTVETGSRDIVVSGLVLNFVPDPSKALSEMRRVLRPHGMVGFYVWDYPGRGVEFLREFWTAAIALDPKAADLAENVRFPFCTQDGLMELASNAGFVSVSSTKLEAPTRFKDFEDFWHPFTLGSGPAPGYCVSLSPDKRAQLCSKLEEALPRAQDGSITLSASAWGIKGTAG
jgi:ubiquinone/menaquinone biosynthesis C-methylase UbiE